MLCVSKEKYVYKVLLVLKGALFQIMLDGTVQTFEGINQDWPDTHRAECPSYPNASWTSKSPQLGISCCLKASQPAKHRQSHENIIQRFLVVKMYLTYNASHRHSITTDCYMPQSLWVAVHKTPLLFSKITHNDSKLIFKRLTCHFVSSMLFDIYGFPTLWSVYSKQMCCSHLLFSQLCVHWLYD